jgi:hypothetical protein
MCISFSSQTCKQQIHNHLQLYRGQAIDKIDKINGVGAGSKGAPTLHFQKGEQTYACSPFFARMFWPKLSLKPPYTPLPEVARYYLIPSNWFDVYVAFVRPPVSQWSPDNLRTDRRIFF